MSTLTDSDDARRECCRDTASAAATIARLTRERDEARAAIVAEVVAERASHAGRGYGASHDAQHGLDHLHRWAEHYASMGTREGVVKAASLVLAAAELRAMNGGSA